MRQGLRARVQLWVPGRAAYPSIVTPVRLQAPVRKTAATPPLWRRHSGEHTRGDFIWIKSTLTVVAVASNLPNRAPAQAQQAARTPSVTVRLDPATPEAYTP